MVKGGKGVLGGRNGLVKATKTRNCTVFGG